MAGDNSKSNPTGAPSYDPNYANARGKPVRNTNEKEGKETDPQVSPASLPNHLTDKRLAEREEGETVQIHDGNYAQYMNRGSGRYEEFLPEQGEGSFGPDANHGGKTRRIHRQKSSVPRKGVE